MMNFAQDASAPCLEEGEISDSSDSEKRTAEQIDTSSEIKSFEMTFQPIHSAAGYRTAQSAYTDSSDDDSSGVEEQELNTSPVKAKRSRPSINPFCSANSFMQHNGDFLRASCQFQKRQNQDLWHKVALEQTIDDSIRKVNTVEKDSDDEYEDRGVESYNYKHKSVTEEQSPLREVIDYSQDTFGDDEQEVDTEELDIHGDFDPEVNICDRESFGVDANGKAVLPGQAQTRHSRKRTIKDRISRRFLSSSVEPCHRKCVKERLGGKKSHPLHKFREMATFQFECKEHDPPDVVAASLIRALGEPQYQMELFERVVNTVGVKKAIELYYITENIEENGGMLVQNGNRRRSPGGVFLQMVKQDSATTKEKIRLMFPFQKTKKLRKKQSRPVSMETNASELCEKELPTKAEVLMNQERRKVSMDTAENSDDLDLDTSVVNVEVGCTQEERI